MAPEAQEQGPFDWIQQLARRILSADPGAAPAAAEPAPTRSTRSVGNEQEREARQEERRARYAVELALKHASWVHRRIEAVQFPEAETARRRMSIDFSLSGRRFARDETIYLPVMVLRKTDLRNFDIVDQEGNSLPILTATENAEIATDGIAQLLEQSWPKELGVEAHEVLHPILAEPDPGEALKLAECALSGQGLLGAAINDVGKKDALVAAVLEALIKELAQGFLLLVPIEYLPGRRRIIKFSYDAAHPPRTSDDETEASPRQSVTSKGRKTLLKVLASLGLSSMVEEFQPLSVGWSSSYHLEVIPPVDTFVEAAELRIDDGQSKRLVARDTHPYRPHVWVSNRKRGDAGEFTLFFHAQRQSVFLPLVLASFVISATLAFVPHYEADLDTQALAGLLLVPLALVAYYVRLSENSYLRSGMMLLRLAAGVPVLAGFFVLALVTFKELDNLLLGAEIAAWASIGATLVMLAAYAAPYIDWNKPKPVRTGSQESTEEHERSPWSKWGPLAVLLAVAGGILWGLIVWLPI